MPVRNLDTHDDPRRPKDDATKASLDERKRETTTITDLSQWAQEDDPLAAFAAEPTQGFIFFERDRAEQPERFERLERLERPERPERLERPERPERLERPERPERPERLKLALGVLALAGVAFATVTALNSLGNRQESQPDIPAQVSVESSDPSAPLFSLRTEPAAPVVEVGRVNEPAQKAPALRKAERVDGPETLNRGTERAAPAPTQVVEQPSGAPVVGSVALRAADSAAPPAAELPAPTTGVAPAESTTRSPVATPIVAAVAPAPPAAAAAAAPPPVAPAPPPAIRVAVPRTAVESVLGRYASTFSALDARGAKAVWPSVNQRSLEKAFDSLEQQEFDLGTCDIMVLPPRALAQCDGTARYTPKVGNKKERTVTRHWTFRLQQNGQDWSIESVDSR